MTTNQEGVHLAVRDITGTARSYNEDWHALFDAEGITAGTFNERMLGWINATLSASYTNLNEAMQAFAVEQGFANWASMNTFVAGSEAATFLRTYGPYGMVMNFADDASIAIKEASGVLDFTSQGQVSGGAPVGPGAKLTYSAPSPKLTEQADGALKFQAHNLCLYSNDFSQAQWVKTGATVVTTTAPDAYGGNTATEFLQTSGVGVVVLSNITTSSVGMTFVGAQHMVTVALKSGATNSTPWMEITTTSPTRRSWVNISTGAVGTVASGHSVVMTSIGAGWWSIAVTVDAVTAASQLYFNPRSGDGSSVTITGDGVSSFLVNRVHVRRLPSVDTYIATTSAAAYDLPYVYSGGVLQSILPEPAATNLFLNNTDFSAGTWGTANITVLVNQTAAPDGTTTADLVYPTTTGSARRFTTGVATSAVTYTNSIYAKYAGIPYIYFFKNDGSALAAWFNIQTGTVGTVGSGYTATITPAPNGFYRCTVTGTGAAGSSYAGYIGLSSSDNSEAVTASGTNGVYLWAAQLETGTVATSPIITYGAAVARAADNASMLGALFPLSSSEGTLFVEVVTPSSISASTDARPASLNDGSTNNRAFIYANVDGLKFGVRSGGALSADINAGAISASTSYKMACAYALNDFAASLNGAAVVTDTSGAVPIGLNSLHVGHAANSTHWNGPIKRIAYFPRRLSDAELQAITA